MTDPVVEELREQGRGFTGAFLVVGVTFLYTMESWQLGRTLPIEYLLAYAIVGFCLIMAVTWGIGFRQADRLASVESAPVFALGVETAEILFQSLLAAYVGLLVLGVLRFGDPVDLFVRLGLMEVVPLGFGAAVANRLVTRGEVDESEGNFPRSLAVFFVGSVFIASTIAPTEEVTVIAARTGWIREFILVVLSVALAYLILYELEFKGQGGRLQTTRWAQFGRTLTAYAVGVVVSFTILAGYGQFMNAAVPVIVSETIVLAFPASLGAAGAEVVI